jgi:phospholipase C
VRRSNGRSVVGFGATAFVVVSLIVPTATLAGADPGGAKGRAKAPSAQAGSSGGIANIDHVVVLMQENRSYDSYFSQLHFEGQPQSPVESEKPNPNPFGGPPIHPFLTTNPCTTADLSHGWDSTHNEIDGGRMNGFTTQNEDPTDPTGSRAMGYYDQRTLPFYYGIANEFSIADRYFASVPGPTFPNRFYLLTGSSFGHVSNVIQTYTQRTIFQSLDEAATPVSWKIYLASVQVELLFEYVLGHAAGHVFPISQYFTDAANGTLPQVSFVESDPFGDVNTESDEHPPANVQVGEKFTHDIVSALVNSPDWASAAMFLTYDEHGGFYDHVSPPAAVPPDDIPPMVPPGDPFNAFDRYGVRVPTTVISPYARPHHVSHVVYDHTSILKFIETRFGLPPLTRRDAAADPMLDMFDFSRASLLHPIVPDAPIDPAGIKACKALHP